MIHKPTPKIVTPFDQETFSTLKEHVRHVRKMFDWPGAQVHDVNEPAENKFNRWYWHNLPMLVELHHDLKVLTLVSELAQQQLKPSYCFLSMYNKFGICPKHIDRPQCQFTLDLQISSDGSWPIYVEEKPYVLENGQALFYSGTGQVHYRNSMVTEGQNCTFMDLAFFHFVPTSWMGRVE